MKNTLIAAKLEIEQLRKQKQLLEAQMAVVHIFGAAVGYKKPGEGMRHPDVVYQLNNLIKGIGDIENDRTEKEKIGAIASTVE